MKKVFLVLVMILSSLIAKPLNGDIDYTNDNIIQNNVIDTQEIGLDNTITEELIIPLENDEDVVETEEIIDEDEVKEPVIENKTTKTQNNNSNKSEEKQVKVTTTPKQEQVETKQEEKVVEQPKVEEKQVETPKPKEETKPKQEEKIYCVDGGKTHIYGDGANEHGYYKTWDEAFKAYEEYTKGWESTQFKIDQCACGLYYFWVIK